MVQLTHARIDGWLNEDGTPKLLSARAYDKIQHGHLVCRCPDPHCPATLSRHAEHDQTFYDPRTGEAYRLKIADFYQREGGAPFHDASCSAVKQYEAYQSYARKAGALSLGEGAMVFNLNILTDRIPAPLRQQKGSAVSAYGNAVRTNILSDDAEKSHHPLSQGINSTQQLARMIEETVFNTDLRRSMVMRIGKRHFTLDQIFHEDPLKFFYDRYALSKEGQGAGEPVLVQFQPIAIAAQRDDVTGKVTKKFHDKASRTIIGQAAQVIAGDGQKYYVSVMLHCGTEEIYKDIKDSIRQKARSFMIYSEDAYVNRPEFMAKKQEVQHNPDADRGVFVHVHVNKPGQIYIRKPVPVVAAPTYGWGENPVAPLLDVDQGVLKKPQKDIPPQLVPPRG